MNTKTIYAFAEAINAHDIGAIYALMTDDHTFIDAQGNQVTGRDKMKAGWAAYFQWFPDYSIEINEVFDHADTFAVFGFASGTFKAIKTEKNSNHFRLPAAWKAVVKEGKISLWQVYADTKIPFDIIQSNNH